MTVDAYVNKIHVSGGLGGQVSATYTLAVPQHTGQAYHHELWKHQVPLSPFSSPIAPPSGVLLARLRTSFIFLPGLATLTPGFKSTVRYRSCLLRAKVRQLHQFSLRGSTRYRTGTVLEYIDLLAKTKTLNILKSKSQHTLYTRTGYIPEY